MTYLECKSAVEVIERARAVERRKRKWSSPPRRFSAKELEALRAASKAAIERAKQERDAQMAERQNREFKMAQAIAEGQAQVKAKTIIRATCNVMRVGRADLCSARRYQSISVPRHAAMEIIRRMTGMSFPAIGRLLGGRDHSTVLHGCRNAQANPDAFAPILAAIEAEVVRLMVEQGDETHSHTA
jgi:chromosomal replication initiation ATPase DnaA